jgi:glyoxylase-like metal-dependent hydrolase (beta-lactamase superfamily II)
MITVAAKRIITPLEIKNLFCRRRTWRIRRSFHSEYERLVAGSLSPGHEVTACLAVAPQVELEPPPPVRSSRSEALDRRRAHRRQRVRDAGPFGDARDGWLAVGVHHPGESGRSEPKRGGRESAEDDSRGVHGRYVLKHVRAELDSFVNLSRPTKSELVTGAAIGVVEDGARSSPTGQHPQVGDGRRGSQPPIGAPHAAAGAEVSPPTIAARVERSWSSSTRRCASPVGAQAFGATRVGRRFDFIGQQDAAADAVNPSLWRQAQLITKAGLFKVVDGLYQVRNNDTGNLTIIDGPTGLVIIDCMTAIEPAQQGLALFREYVSDKPIVVIIYTHTHIDHYGGVKGLVDPADVASGKVPIIAPDTIRAFDKFAIGENVGAGNAMSRRAGYAFGNLLDFGPEQFLSCGIAVGAVVGPVTVFLSLADRRDHQTGDKRELGGFEFEGLYAPDTEAPEEMHIWIPELKALTCAENANHSLHNIQTLRGARTRDARNFARYLDETLELWGDQAEVHYGPHTWPVWGNAEVGAFLESQRDTYKYIHDQVLRLANKGYSPLEAAEVIELPDELGRKWFNRGYHGALHHDVRAVYTKELGMWDGDPVSPHPPSTSRVRQALRAAHWR